MVYYNCPRCNYRTDRKSNFINHLLRKKACLPILNEITREEILEKINMNKDMKGIIIDSEKTLFDSKMTQNDSIVDSKNDKIKHFECCYCNKNFSRKNNLVRHQKNCKSKNKIGDENETLRKENEYLVKKVEEMFLKMNKMEEEIKNYKKNNFNNSFNTIKNNKIQINSYGCENIDYITDKVFMKLLNTPLSAIPKLIELKHFNPSHPENHNVKITNIHDKFAKIYKDNKWLISHKKNVIQELVDNGYADFEEFKDLNEEEVTFKIKEKYKKLEKYYMENPDQLYKKSEVSVINGTSKVEDVIV